MTSLTKNPSVIERENSSGSFFILSILTRSKATIPWTKESSRVNSSVQHENTYGTREAAEADLTRFQVWAEKGKRHRENFPFVREIKRSLAESLKADLPQHFWSPVGSNEVIDLRKVQFTRSETSNLDLSPSDPRQASYGSKK